MNNITSNWNADRGYAMPSACVVPSHASVTFRGMRGAIDLQAGLVATPKFGAGPRPWSPPIT